MDDTITKTQPPAFCPTVHLRIGAPAAEPSGKLVLPTPVYIDHQPASSSASSPPAPAPPPPLPAFVFLRQAHGAAAYTLVTGGGLPYVWSSSSSSSTDTRHSTPPPPPVAVLRTLSTVRPRRFLRPARVVLGSPSSCAPPQPRNASAAFDMIRKWSRGVSSSVRFCAPPLSASGVDGVFEWEAAPTAAAGSPSTTTYTLYHVTQVFFSVTPATSSSLGTPPRRDGARRVVARLQRGGGGGSGRLAVDVEGCLSLAAAGGGAEKDTQETEQQRKQLVAAVVTTALCLLHGAV